MTFEELAKKISPVLKRIAYRLRYSSSSFNEEDLFQEALVHLWDDFNSGKLGDKTDSYILQGCYFHLKNYIRTHREKRPVFSLDYIVDEDSTGLKDSLWLADEASRHYFEHLNDRMLAEVIRNNGLLPKEKKILSFYAQGLTTREIGSRLGVSHVMVIKMTARIREKCIKYID